MGNYSYVSNADVSTIDNMYASYKENPESIDYSWRKFLKASSFHKTTPT